MPLSSRIRCVSILSLLAASAHAQSSLEWSAAHSAANGDEYGQAVAVAADGSVYVAGQIPSKAYNGVPQSDIRLAKFSNAGAAQWTVEWDTYGFVEGVGAIAIGPGGDVFVSGSASDSFNGDATLRRFTPDGVEQWLAVEQGFGGMQLGYSRIAFLSNGDIVASGRKHFSTLISCYSPSGALRWTHSVGGGFGGNVITDLSVTADDDIFACGVKGTPNNGAMALYKYASDGTLLWTSLVDENAPQRSFGGALAPTAEGSVVVAGSRSIGSLSDTLLARFDPATGAVEWTLVHDTGGQNWDEWRDVEVGADGTIWVSGRRNVASGDMDTIAARISPHGALLSLADWAAGANLYDQAQSLHVGAAGQAWVLAMLGQTPRDVALLQFDSSGELSTETVVDLGASSDDIGYVSALAPGGRLVVAGTTNATTNGDYDLLALQFDLRDAPSGYCTPKVNSLGCAPHLSFVGASSASASSGFSIVCTNVRSHKQGLLLYGLNGAAATPFLGGTLCVQAPLRRTPVGSSGGAAGADDCSGVFSFDMNAFAAGVAGGQPAPELSTAGVEVSCQQWSRDPGASANVGLSAGLRYRVQP